MPTNNNWNCFIWRSQY